MSGPRMPDLTQAILARTSGSTCEHLQSLACDYVDEALGGTRALLVEGHLAHCEGCSALIANLRLASAGLPSFAEADPGPWFTQRILKASAAASNPWWSRLLRRPRIALEAAYLATALCVLVLSVPLGDKAIAPLGSGASAVVQGLHVVADTLETLSAPTEPSRPSLRFSP